MAPASKRKCKLLQMSPLNCSWCFFNILLPCSPLNLPKSEATVYFQTLCFPKSSMVVTKVPSSSPWPTYLWIYPQNSSTQHTSHFWTQPSSLRPPVWYLLPSSGQLVSVTMGASIWLFGSQSPHLWNESTKLNNVYMLSNSHMLCLNNPDNN